MIRKLTTADFQAIYNVVNDAAVAYRGKIPSDCWKEPYMPCEEIEDEIRSGVQFYGYEQDGEVVAVMGIQIVGDVTLIRHAYTFISQQRKGIGKKLLFHLLGLAQTERVLVGTWIDAPWAMQFYQKHGFKLHSRNETDKLLKKYWKIPKRQIETSLVLEYQRQNIMKKTLKLKVNPQNPNSDSIQKAAEIIKRGGLVAFPTETVYGLGADALNAEAVLALFEAKKRPLDNPPIVHVDDPKEVSALVVKVPQKAKVLMEKFWPGPLTLIFKRSNKVPKQTTAGLDTIAIRMPNNKVALELIRKSGRPVAAPSANLAGKPSSTTAQHVFEDLKGRIDAIIDGGATKIGVESTVVDLTVDPPMLLRPGGTPFELLQQVVDDLQLHPFVQSKQELPLETIRSPGMKHKHYAPKANVVLVEGELSAAIEKVKALAKSYHLKEQKVGILATDQTQSNYNAEVVVSMGSRSNLATVAQNLFRLLREVDEQGVDVIIAEGVSSEGIGLAVMNRLRKAADYHIAKAEE
jgi:L-threonylcarbamoyladenylate synthase